MVEGLKPFTNRIIYVVIKYRQIFHTRNPNLGVFTRCSNTTMKANNGPATMQTTLNNVKAAGAAAAKLPPRRAEFSSQHRQTRVRVCLVVRAHRRQPFPLHFLTSNPDPVRIIATSEMELGEHCQVGRRKDQDRANAQFRHQFLV